MSLQSQQLPNGNTLDEGLAVLYDLLEIHSPSGEEMQATAHLTQWMTKRGLVARRDAAGNAVGILEPSAPAPGGGQVQELILLGHIDTVPGFPRVVVRDGKLYGRGAVDAKGPLVAFATAAIIVGPQPGWRIIVAGAVEEEAVTSKGARYLLTRHRPALVVIGEPTGWQRVALGYKGRLLADVMIQRLISHTARKTPSAPELAFAFWNQVVAGVEAMNAGREKVWDQVQATIRDISRSDDGIVETAGMELGFRLPLDVTPEQIRAFLVSLDSQTGLRFRGEEFAYRAEKNTPLVRAFLAAVRSQGGEPGFVVKTCTCDMNVTGPVWRCPILAYGPGDSTLDHTPQEHIEIAEWRQGVAVLADALRRVTA
ncbi:MAG: [LysW]-lysine hydrolase [Chloroflexi bacterium]|nr:[LysW]-lysine hydrolase [Chloroflexota bacterium]